MAADDAAERLAGLDERPVMSAATSQRDTAVEEGRCVAGQPDSLVPVEESPLQLCVSQFGPAGEELPHKGRHFRLRYVLEVSVASASYDDGSRLR